MSYQPRTRTGTPRAFKRSKRVRSKTKSERSQLVGTYSQDKNATSLDVLVGRTINGLATLGDQTFGLPPFHEYFGDWLMNLRAVLTDFESSQVVTLDDQFRDECSRLLLEVESALSDMRLTEASRAEAARRLLNSKGMLSQIEQKHVAEMKELTDRKRSTTKPLADRVETLQEELDEITHMRTGFLRGISEKTKAQKEIEVTLRLTSANKELKEVERSFVNEESRLREEYEHRKLEILEQIENDQREIEKLESASQVDGSAELRRSACETLANAVNSLLKREIVSKSVVSSS